MVYAHKARLLRQGHDANEDNLHNESATASLCHVTILKTKRGARNTYVQRDGNENHGDVEPVQVTIFGQPVLDQLRVYQMDEFQVQAQVDQSQQSLLDAIPHIVDGNPPGIDLEPRGHPDDEHGDVDEADQARH